MTHSNCSTFGVHDNATHNFPIFYRQPCTNNSKKKKSFVVAIEEDGAKEKITTMREAARYIKRYKNENPSAIIMIPEVLKSIKKILYPGLSKKYSFDGNVYEPIKIGKEVYFLFDKPVMN